MSSNFMISDISLVCRPHSRWIASTAPWRADTCFASPTIGTTLSTTFRIASSVMTSQSTARHFAAVLRMTVYELDSAVITVGTREASCGCNDISRSGATSRREVRQSTRSCPAGGELCRRLSGTSIAVVLISRIFYGPAHLRQMTPSRLR
jgi:hypothetical protein